MWTHTLTLNAHERAVLRKDGLAHRWLEPGRHRLWHRWGGMPDVVMVDVRAISTICTPELDAVIPADAAQRVHVAEGHLAMVTIDGHPRRVLTPGKHLVWQGWGDAAVKVVDTAPLLTALPRKAWPLAGSAVRQVSVAPWQQAVVSVDGAEPQVLGPGEYGLNAADRDLMVQLVDCREMELVVSGQEVMSADKVTLRANLVVQYRVTDAVRAVVGRTNLSDALYSQAQMVARQVMTALTLDALLEQREALSGTLVDLLTKRIAGWGIQVSAMGIRDLILPGEMRALMNRVIEAEKQAAANLILRREETAATRSLANTAKVLASNPVLMRLKELEALREVAESVGELRVVTGVGGLGELAQLGRVVSAD